MTTSAIFRYFLYLGIAGFGGPLAIIEYIRRDLVYGKRWMTLEEFKDYFGYSQIAPGPLAFQVALYFAYHKKGLKAAILAGTGLVLPSFLIVLLFSIFYKSYHEISWIVWALYGISPVVISIIFHSGYNLSRSVFTKEPIQYILFAGVIIVSYFFRVHIIYMILSSALISLVYHIIKRKAEAKAISVNLFVLGLIGKAYGSILLLFEFANGKLLQLAYIFLKAGMLTYGSGFVIVGVLRQDVVDNFSLITAKEFLDGVAFGQITPGPVVITSTFIGYLVSGFTGSVLTTVSVFLPTFIFVIIISKFINKIKDNFYLKSAIKGANAASIAAIMATGYFLSAEALIDYYTFGFFAAALGILFFTKLKPYYVIISGAAAGVIVKLILN
ncbi:MAG: chromate efflux transporter [Ignavibacteria bacterium]|nr:chromate efflux transporter [Ignavibacteria bacterium]